ncbi:hypothetical protein cco112_03278, partial [Campylobacter coli 2685]
LPAELTRHFLNENVIMPKYISICQGNLAYF